MIKLHLAIAILLTLPAIATNNQYYNHMTKEKNLPPYTFGQKVGKIESPQLAEISGLAPSSRYNDCFWAHNDSGDQANLYLINLSGELIATLSLPISNRDWEAVTIADGYLYIGEVGDNRAIYTDKRVYKVEEPATIDINARDQKLSTAQYETMIFNFADGKRDCETMMYDPATDQLIFVSKREEQVRVYAAPFIANKGGEALLINSFATLNFTLVTDGDISLDATKILIKSYDNIYFWRRTEGQTLAQVFATEPTVLAYDPEPQGESIAWSTHEDVFYTVSEKWGDEPSIIYGYRRTVL
ncbi:MAG: hypothetical protein R3Y44_04705 [Rikenellaceae bacterium]